MGDRILDINEKELQKFIDRNRPPVHLRKQLDIGFNYDGRVIEIYDIRPGWSDSSVIMNLPFAKNKYVKAHKIWKLYWMRASGKWESYEPIKESSHLKKLLDCIDEDIHGCFKG